MSGPSPIAIREQKITSPAVVKSAASAALPAPELKKSQREAQVRNWWDQVRLASGTMREEMARDEDFVDHEQWDPADKAALEALGQKALTFNLIAPTVHWMTGTEKKTRVDYRVLPRRQEGTKDAENKTSLLKYVSDTSRVPFERSRAFEDTICAGLGWLEEGIRNDPDEEPLFVRYESWRNIWQDLLSVEPDLDDARYLFRSRWLDLDVAEAMFPDQVEELRRIATELPAYAGQDETEDVGNPYLYQGVSGAPLSSQTGSRPRVRLVECWYRTPEKVKVLRGSGGWSGSILHPANPVQAWALQSGLASTYDAVRMVMRCMIFADSPRDVGRGISCVLQDEQSPYWHNRFPFTPIWAYRRKRDNAPYGPVRGLRDPQTDLNKRRSKALRLMSTNQIIAEETAVADWAETLKEVNREDGLIRLTGPNKKFEIRNQAVLASSHIAIMDQDARYIQQVGGVTDENMGKSSNAVSGRAIEARQNQGHTTTADLFDNLRYAIQISGEKQLALIEQFYDQEKQIRINGERGIASFVTLNGGEENPITAQQADFVVDEQDFRATIRQAMFEQLLEITAKLPPEVGLRLMALAFDLSDIPLRDEFSAELRKITGAPTPGKELSPEEATAQAAKEAEGQRQQQRLEAEQDANLRLLLAKAKDLDAAGTEKMVKALYSAMQAGQVLALAPQVAPIADQIAKSAGFVDSDSAPIVAPTTAETMNVPPMLPPDGPGVGMMTGIETPGADGVRE